jgi:hypothetical protein
MGRLAGLGEPGREDVDIARSFSDQQRSAHLHLAARMLQNKERRNALLDALTLASPNRLAGADADAIAESLESEGFKRAMCSLLQRNISLGHLKLPQHRRA